MVSQPLQLHTTICLTKALVFGVSWRRARGWQLSGNDSRGGLGLLTILNAICVICFVVVPFFSPLFPFFFFFWRYGCNDGNERGGCFKEPSVDRWSSGQESLPVLRTDGGRVESDLANLSR